MRLRDIIDLVAAADLPAGVSDDAAEALSEARPKGSLDADQWRRKAEKQQRIAQQKRDETARHAKRMSDLAAKSTRP